MKVGFDIDDVTVEFMPFLLDFYNSEYNGNLRLEDVFSFKLWEIGIGNTKEETIKIVYDFYSSKFYDRMPFVNGARKGILKIGEKNEVFFVSARYSIVRDKTRRFLIEQFPKSQVFYSGSYIDLGKTKAEICLENGIEVMVEDEPGNALECNQAGVRTLLLNKPWNQGLNEKIERVYNWSEILEKINLIGRKNE